MTPATWGHAIDVPEKVAYSPLHAWALPAHAELMDEPGACISRILPKLENPDLSSVIVVDPTVIAPQAEAGEVFIAF